MTQTEVQARTGLSQATISNLERGHTALEWDRAIAFAGLYEIPLQWGLSGTVRPAETLAGLASELSFYGLKDVLFSDALVPGAFRRFEEVFVLALSEGTPHPRIVEAAPTLLLVNEWSHEILGGFAKAYQVAQRIGWLADIALFLCESPHLRAFPRSVRHGELERLASSFDVPTQEDSLGAPARHKDRLPFIWKRWKVTWDEPLEHFVERAMTIFEILDGRQERPRTAPPGS